MRKENCNNSRESLGALKKNRREELLTDSSERIQLATTP
jgi:hypothetical protein